VHVVVVYDTAVERNPAILRTCRLYLHHVQRSVFEGQLSDAQVKRFERAVKDVIDDGHDHVLVYTFPPGVSPQRMSWGIARAEPSDIL
jgi:CRISPR-associated protein Cas2